MIFRAIGQDDSLIDDLRLIRGAVDKANARCEVVIEECAALRALGREVGDGNAD